MNEVQIAKLHEASQLPKLGKEALVSEVDGGTLQNITRSAQHAAS